MRKELLRASTILRYPKQKRRNYIRVMPNKLDYLFSEVTPTIEQSIPLDEPTDIRTLNLYTSGKLVEDLTSPWFWQVSRLIGQYTHTRIICHQEFIGLVDPIRTYILVGAPTNIQYCYLLLRWAYYSIKWGTTSKNKHLAVSIIIEKLKIFLATAKKSGGRMSLSDSYRDKFLYNKHGLPKVKHNQVDDVWAMVVTINMNTLPEATFKNRKLIC